MVRGPSSYPPFSSLDRLLGEQKQEHLAQSQLKQNRFHEEYSGSVARLGVGGFGVVHLVHDRFYF